MAVITAIAPRSHQNTNERLVMHSTYATAPLQFERATGAIGAWVRGVSLGEPAQPETARTLQHALAEHGVLFFDFGRIPDSGEFITLAAHFGTVEARYGQKVAGREEPEVPFIDSDRAPMKDVYVNWWHTDGTPLECPPLAAALTPLELPSTGGDTMWASMYAAYDALSPHIQNLLGGLQALHSNRRPSFLQPREYTHPAVLTNPITGRKSLFVNSVYTERLIGLSERESDALLHFLAEHVNTPEFHVRLKWQPGYVAVWHQRVTQHRGVDDFSGPRKLKRLTIVGDQPR